MRESLDHPYSPADAAIRTQLGAIMKNVSTYARAARQLGVVDKVGLEESLGWLNEYLRTAEVFGALKDFQAEALYDAGIALNAAYKVAAADGSDSSVATKEAFGRACESLRKFWASMGEVSSAP